MDLLNFWCPVGYELAMADFCFWCLFCSSLNWKDWLCWYLFYVWMSQGGSEKLDALCICMFASLLSLATNGNSVFCKSLASTLSIMWMFRAFDAGLFDEARSSTKSDLLYEPRSSPCACTFWSCDCAICCCERVEFSSFMLYSMLLNSLPSWHGAN